MKEHIRILTADRITRASTVLAIIFFVITLGILIVSFQNLPPYIPVFNQLPWGVDRLGNMFSIFLPLLIAAICAITNFILAGLLYSQLPLLARMLSVTSFLVFLLCLIFTIRTILLIT